MNELIKLNKDFVYFVDRMPEYIKNNYFVKTYKRDAIISQKYDSINNLGIIITGVTRVINEFENGRTFLVETNLPIDFIGEVAILSRKKDSSVTIIATESCTVLYIPRDLAEKWIFSNFDILKTISSKVAFKLYRSSLNKGDNIIYSNNFVIANYIFTEARRENITTNKLVKINKTREIISEETGINVKTLNRLIGKLKEDGYIQIDRGKIIIDRVNYLKLNDFIEERRFD